MALRRVASASAPSTLAISHSLGRAAGLPAHPALAAAGRTRGCTPAGPAPAPAPARARAFACGAAATAVVAAAAVRGPTPAAVAALRCPSRREVLLPLLQGAGYLAPRPRASSAAGANRLAASAMSTDAGAGAGAGAGGSSPTGAIVVYVTVPNAEVGDSLAAKLVESKLAACVNIVPGLTSVYWWDGKVNRDPELLLIIKTREELLGQLTEFVRANHPYDEPEVVGLPILGGSPSYLKWLRDSAAGPSSS